MWTSHQPFVIPLKIKNFEDDVKKNRAKQIQSKNDILMPILKDIVEIKQIEANIIDKFLIFLEKKDLNIQEKSIIFSDEIKKKITTGVFKSLNKEEIKYLDQNFGLAKNKETQKPYALSFNYFGEMYQKTLVHISEIDDEESKGKKTENKARDFKLKPLISKVEVIILSDPKKGDYVDNLFFEWETENALKFRREKDEMKLWIPKSAINGPWIKDSSKKQKIFLNFIPDNFNWIWD